MARIIAPVLTEADRDIGTQSAQSTQRSFCSLRPLRPLHSSFLSILLVLFAVPALAHDLEHTQVLLSFARDGSFVLDVSNDPAWLKLRLESIPGPFIDRVVLFVDGREIRPSRQRRD